MTEAERDLLLAVAEALAWCGKIDRSKLTRVLIERDVAEGRASAPVEPWCPLCKRRHAVTSLCNPARLAALRRKREMTR